MSQSRLPYPGIQEIENAMKKHAYINVSSSPRKYVSIKNIVDVLTKHPDYIYVPALRLMGKQQDVYNTIMSIAVPTQHGLAPYYTPEQADEYVTISYDNLNNYSVANLNNPEVQTRLRNEMIETAEARREAKQKKILQRGNAKILLSELGTIYEMVFGEIAPSNKYKGKNTLEKLYLTLPQGKVLDVSKYNPKTGRGAKIINIPKQNSAKIGAPQVNIVSDNLLTYEQAVQSLFSPQDAAILISEYKQREASLQHQQHLNLLLYQQQPSLLQQQPSLLQQQPSLLQQQPSLLQQQPSLLQQQPSLHQMLSPKIPTSNPIAQNLPVSQQQVLQMIPNANS